MVIGCDIGRGVDFWEEATGGLQAQSCGEVIGGKFHLDTQTGPHT